MFNWQSCLMKVDSHITLISYVFRWAYSSFVTHIVVPSRVPGEMFHCQLFGLSGDLARTRPTCLLDSCFTKKPPVRKSGQANISMKIFQF